jgi:DNA (cytosine-5)-methyltransferase 1
LDNDKRYDAFVNVGGLEFEAAGFETIWANEFDKAIWETFEKNFPKTMLDKRSIREVPFRLFIS